MIPKTEISGSTYPNLFFIWTILSYIWPPIASFMMWESASSMSGSDRAINLLPGNHDEVPLQFCQQTIIASANCDHINYLPQAGFNRGPSVATISWEIACCLAMNRHHCRFNTNSYLPQFYLKIIVASVGVFLVLLSTLREPSVSRKDLIWLTISLILSPLGYGLRTWKHLIPRNGPPQLQG